MDMKTDTKGHGFINNIWAQAGITAIAAIALVALAAHYVW
jgi:hypothetical protein